ncbi:MAG TPA: phosphotransferase family protein [Candidatus Kryptonia bacterium]|nr:phosphotransferase family protein [Candidatus Kryptonia bacterium]
MTGDRMEKESGTKGGPKVELAAALARVLTERVAGYRSLQTCERLSGGASQETYRVVIETDDGPRKLAMRRAPGGTKYSFSGAGPGLPTEAKLLGAARAADVPEPAILYVFEERDGLGDGFLMEWLEGETLGARITRAPELDAIRPQLARQCGEVLARIHAIDVRAGGLADVLQPRTPEQLVRETWELYQAYGTPQPMIDFAARWLLEHLPPASPPRLVHGDFRNGNLMISAERGIVAVLDWELAHLGDPMRDLGWLCTNSWRFGRSELPVGGFGTVDDLLAGYASVSGVAVDPDHVKFWIVFGSFWWAVGCLSMAQFYRLGVDKSVERPTIGRRSSECQVDCVNLLIPGPVEEPARETKESTLDMPRANEMLTSVRDFLRNDVMSGTTGRTNFLARVAANSLDIVLRELELGPAHRIREQQGLERILGHAGDLETLRWELVRALRDGSMPLDRSGLADHLRQTVVTQVAIDQPQYSGYRAALGKD